MSKGKKYEIVKIPESKTTIKVPIDNPTHRNFEFVIVGNSEFKDKWTEIINNESIIQIKRIYHGMFRPQTFMMIIAEDMRSSK